MSNLNFDWLRENLQDNMIVFDIGCADMGDTLRLKAALPQSTFYAFECANVWLESNLKVAADNNITYFHLALSDVDGVQTFYPSSVYQGEQWPWSGSVCKPGEYLQSDTWQWGAGYTVPSTTLETFCTKHRVTPDFVHIDVQGAEYKVFSKLGTIRPKCIWAEISEFTNYETGVDYETFHALMVSYGYRQLHKDSWDSLYVYKDLTCSDYVC
jgi:FkbM family methyltransferase